ncbi:MAG: hypothetical protein IJE45_01745 [Bacilli bacterium]|nr:hypothetical protein [Bacilli bacterium]
MNEKLKFVGYLLIYKKIEGADLITQTITDMLTYSPHMDKLYIFNYNKQKQVSLLEAIKNYKNIEYVDLTSYGQVKNYKNAVTHAIEQGADFATILETGYYYEDNAYLDIRRRIMMGEFSEKDAVITPMPVYTCEENKSSSDIKRNIKGSHLTGAFINLHIYNKTPGFYEPYYQTTFDYDYCLTVRKEGYNVVLMNNHILRNRNYRMLYKKILWHTYDAYGHDIYDVYYETRNRLYLWDKFYDFDKEYIKIDKKQQSLEFKEMRLFEKNFREKKQIINQARIDYRLKKMGKAFEEINF